MSKVDGKKAALGVAVAAAVGYVAGILTAPKSGKETREDIKNTTEKAYKNAEEKLKSAYEDLGETIDKAVTKAKDLGSRQKKELDKLIDIASDAQDKARQMLRAVRKGEADDRDLKKALDSANKAKDHLTKFIKNN
jgi:gas vesicle protein